MLALTVVSEVECIGELIRIGPTSINWLFKLIGVLDTCSR